MSPIGVSAPQRVLHENVVKAGTCIGCGACVTVDEGLDSSMVDTDRGPEPWFGSRARLADWALGVCPGLGIDYPQLYRDHYGRTPDHWLLGMQVATFTGHASDESIRRAGASGGVTTSVLLHLLRTDRIDGAAVVRQGVPIPEKARVVIARTTEEIEAAAQSVYVPVSVLDVLGRFIPGERYAITCLPEQAAALRVLQRNGHPAAQQVRYVVGPYTGTALEPRAIRALLRSHGVDDADEITSLRWRAGEWPGYLEVRLISGRVVRSRKMYYNFLIPFFVTRASLQSMDFANEFADLAVGDAWSPKYESQGGGHSVVVARTAVMRDILEEMQAHGALVLEPIDGLEATEMHGHMLDFKKRGGYLRNRFRRLIGRTSPDYGFRPDPVSPFRVAVELVIITVFGMCRTPPARWVVEHIPERILGPLFNRLRLTWKRLSKPTKRKGLGSLTMVEEHR